MSEKFRDCVTKSSVILTDKEDPSLVAELCYTYQLLYDHESDVTGLWLELIYLTFSALYDKALSPEERIVNVSIVQAILITWREACVKGNAVTKHFITTPTYEDMITGVEGLIMYMILNITKISPTTLCPWYFGSDS